MNGSSSQSPPEFERPPINELVCGVWFQQIEQLIAPYWGLLWEKYRSEYSLCEQHPRLGPLVSGPTVNFPMDSPRVWFTHPDGNKLIQTQSDAFFFNWRRQKLEDVYPGFHCVFEGFCKHFSTFQGFIEEMWSGSVEPICYDLSYIDLIPWDENLDGLTEIGRYFPDFQWRVDRPESLCKPLGVNWQTHFALPNDAGLLTASIVSAHRKSDQTAVIRLEMNARGIYENQGLEGASSWFERTHELIIKAFSYFASAEAQKEKWGLR